MPLPSSPNKVAVPKTVIKAIGESVPFTIARKANAMRHRSITERAPSFYFAHEPCYNIYREDTVKSFDLEEVFYLSFHNIESMREELEPKKVGLPCPKCNNGKLKLSGFSGWREDQESKTFQGFREYECDKCGHKFKAHFVTLYEAISV